MLAIKTTNVTKVYKNSTYPAVKDVSLDVELGKIFTLLGRNGAGKTTMVRMCATQLDLTSGAISIFGFDSVSQTGDIRKLISIVPQEVRSLRALTPWDHVYNWLRIRGETKQNAERKTKEVLKKFELYQTKDVSAMYLSGGMHQKIMVAMAMATDAPLVFLDEPTIGLDPVSRREVCSAIRDLKMQGTSILLTTHYMDEAEMLSDYIVIIDKGSIIAEGTMEDLRKVIPQNVRIDISKDGADINVLKSFGEVVDTGASSFRLFTYDSAVQEISDFALKNKLRFAMAPVSLDDVFVSIVKSEINSDEDDY
jgi:ABC-2 type transport system ATP-binding protein